MAAVILVVLGTIVLAILLVALLPGAGLVGAILVIVVGITLAAWFLSAGLTGQVPSEIASRTETTEHLGPGGPDDPDRTSRRR